MEKKIKQLTFIVGAIIALAVAAVPVSSFATQQVTLGSSYVSLSVTSILTLNISVRDSDDNNMNIGIAPNMLSTGAFTATVTSNKDYVLSLNASDGNVDLVNTTDPTSTIPGNCTIPAGAANNNISATCWNVKLDAGISGVVPAFTYYHAIPASITPIRNGSANADTGEATTVDVGIAVGPSLAPGTYTGALVVTASTSN